MSDITSPRNHNAPTPVHAHTPLGPVQPGERFLFVDVLRGLAVFGILVENLAVYAGYSYDLQTLAGPLRRFVALLVKFLLEAKSYSLLALLLGWGMAASGRRARSRDVGFMPLYLRRILVLFLFGILHGTLVWFGDILVLYAFLGLLLIPILVKRPPSHWILAAAAGALVLSILFAMPGEAMDAFRTWYERATRLLRYSTHAEDVYRTGTYVQITRRRVQDLLGANSWLLYYVGNVLGMVLLGFYIGQRRLFEQVWQHPLSQGRLVHRTLRFGLLIGVPFNAFYAASSLWPDLVPDRYARLVRVGTRTVGAPAMVLLYISAAILFLSSARWSVRWRRRLSLAAHVGRMSLSNYLFQSLVCTWIFYGYGLGLYGQVGPVFGLVFAFILYLGQVRLSEWWFDRYQFGPVEWLWRSLTYWRRQPLRIGSPVGGAGSRPRWSRPARIGVWVLVTATCLVAGGLILCKIRLPTPMDRANIVSQVTSVPLDASLSQDASSPQTEHKAEAFVVATPQVEPALYEPSAIAASGDLTALAQTFDARVALDQIETLTGAPYLGRYPGSSGGRAAGDYLAEQFAAYGLRPAGQDGTFYQSFPIEYVALADVPRLVIELADGTIYSHYELYRDYSAVLSEYSGKGAVAGQVVWANECAHKDFDLLDAVGKVVLCRDGDVLRAQRNALEHGAVGLLLLADPERRPADLGGTRREPWTPEPIVTFRVYPALVQDLLLASQHTLVDLSSSFAPFALTTRVHMRIETVGSESCPVEYTGPPECKGRNILGVLPGRDPRYADQVILVGAHYDHLGESPDATVWPGANDNASGIGVLLGIAKSWYEQGYVPRRTVLFAAWDAEEMGLLGSIYYVQHPRYPLEATVAKIQLDMVGAGTSTLRVDGHGHLGDLMVAIAADLGIDVVQTNMGRSDHVPFREAGVPASLLIWTQDDDMLPSYHRPVDLPSTIDLEKLEAVGQVAGISLLALAEGEPAIRELVDRRVDAVLRGDVSAFLATSSADRQAADRRWLVDLQALGAAGLDMRLDELRVLGRTATARASVVPNPSQESQDTSVRVATAGSMPALFLHDGTGWKWAGPNLVREEVPNRSQNGLPRFAVAYPAGMPGPSGLVQEAEQRYAQLNELLGLDGPGGAFLLYPDRDALRMDTALSLPRELDTWIGFRIVKATQNTHTTNQTFLTTVLCQLALTEYGIDSQAAAWLWDGLPHLVGEWMSGEAPAYLDELQDRDLLSITAGQGSTEPDEISAWAAAEYLRLEIGWQGIGEFITGLGQACQNGAPRNGHDGLQEGEPVRCQNPEALSTTLSDTLGMDGAAFETAWRQYWHDRLAATQTDLDAVLAARTRAILSDDGRAFLETIDAQIPGLMEEERYWFADLAKHPVEHFELAGTPLFVDQDGSLVAEVTMQYRLRGVSGRTGQAAVPVTIRFTPTSGGYQWAGHPFKVLSGEYVHVLYSSMNDKARSVAETLLPDAEATYLWLADELGIERPRPLYVKLYDHGSAFRTSISLSFPSVEWLPAWTSGEGSIKIHVSNKDYGHEFDIQAARYLLNQIGVKSEWLLKGTSLYLADVANTDTVGPLSKVFEASSDGTLGSVSQLLPDHRIEQLADLRISRAHTLDTIRYLITTRPPGSLLRILRAHGHGLSPDGVLRSQIGCSLAEFELEWEQSLSRGHARTAWIDIAQEFDPLSASKHVAYLEQPELAGRQAGSPGDRQAVAYIAAQFAELGLATVVQRFPISYTTLLSGPSLVVSGVEAQPDQALSYRQHYVALFDSSSKGVRVSGPLVWVKNSTHQDMDLEGKIVLCNLTDPLESQVAWAAQRGASGLLLIGKKASKRSALAKNPLPIAFSAETSIPVLELTRQGTDRLLEIVGATRDGLAGSPPALHMGYEVTLDVPLGMPETVETANVLGLLPGSNPKLSQELVILGAHHDHVGNDPDVQYAGANDNASGVGVLIEIARLWQETGYRPQRSVLFAAWGAQEPGEIGSRYYLEHPVRPLTDTIAVLQLDSVGGGRGYFLEAQGDPNREGFLRFTLQAAEDWVDGRLSLTRPSKKSDHSVFREIGIPAVLLTWRESSEDNLPSELADAVEPYRLGVTGRMTSLTLMALAQ